MKMTLKEMFAKIDAQRAGNLFVVRLEIRNRESKHEFSNISDARKFWDKAHKFGMNIDPRP
jgi:hypothetical protein